MKEYLSSINLNTIRISLEEEKNGKKEICNKGLREIPAGDVCGIAEPGATPLGKIRCARFASRRVAGVEGTWTKRRRAGGGGFPSGPEAQGCSQSSPKYRGPCSPFPLFVSSLLRTLNLHLHLHLQPHCSELRPSVLASHFTTSTNPYLLPTHRCRAPRPSHRFSSRGTSRARGRFNRRLNTPKNRGLIFKQEES